MEKEVHTVNITVFNRDKSFAKVNRVLHNYSSDVLLRVGYPFKDDNYAIIFLIAKMTENEIGAFCGKLGQIDCIKVKATKIKQEEGIL